jgi:molybdopterin/thiamine biosynthesis adenylyltransferase
VIGSLPTTAFLIPLCGLERRGVEPTTAADQQSLADGGGDGSGDDVEQDQTASNSNGTTQDASAEANSLQANVYAPEVEGCHRCFNGDVSQSNGATTDATAGNQNWTDQSNDQVQSAGGGSDEGNGSGDDVDQSQTASNSNGTTQSASANATTGQANVYAPTVVYCHRCFNGDVNQSNQASTTASAGNDNGTKQQNGQSQSAGDDVAGSAADPQPTTTIVYITETRVITLSAGTTSSVKAKKASKKVVKKARKHKKHKNKRHSRSRKALCSC